MVKRDLSDYSKYFKSYTELRTQQNRTQNITLVDGNMMGNSEESTSGVSSRVFNNGCWGFASNADYQSDAVKAVISSASENAQFMDSRLKKGSVQLPSLPGNMENDFKTKKNISSQKEKIDFIKELAVCRVDKPS